MLQKSHKKMFLEKLLMDYLDQLSNKKEPNLLENCFSLTKLCYYAFSISEENIKLKANIYRKEFI